MFNIRSNAFKYSYNFKTINLITNDMTQEERIKIAIVELNNCTTLDTEMAHCNADSVLCNLLEELGYGEVVEVYNEIDKWYEQ